MGGKQPFVGGRRMLISLACYRTEAWKSVLACVLSCWTLTAETGRLTLLFLHASMVWVAPPWHAIVFEASHRISSDLTIGQGRVFIVLSASGVAFLSFMDGELLPAVVGSAAAAVCMSSYLAHDQTDPGKLNAVRYSGALACVAWALSECVVLTGVLGKWLPFAGALVFLSEV